MENIERKVTRFSVAGLVALLGVSACGTTLHVQRGEVWYDCHTNEEYPVPHPCYDRVQAYFAAQRTQYGSSSSSEDRKDYFSAVTSAADRLGGREPSGNSGKSGHKDCFKK